MAEDPGPRRIPFFPFYISDFKGHPEVRMMDFQERALYLELLFSCWESSDDCIPDDPVRLARLIGLSVEDFKKYFHFVRDRFTEQTPGRLTHPRIAREKARVRQKSDAQSKAMKKYWADKKGETT